ncbi:MAG TPA: hypothetical protein VGE62_00250 [Candidatus Paceibacterota bacterium]
MESAIAFIYKINQVIINPIILLLFGIAVLVFLYGIFEYVKGSGSEDARATGSRHMVAGVIGLFIMISVFGIMRAIMNTIGANPAENGFNDVIGQ